MRHYYNEFDKFAIAWLKQLIMFGAIPDGDIDERSITEVEAWELFDYDQCHFFAGIGGWAEAIRLANWHGPIWTGSCPCQPFSVAGAQQGTSDKRHLWPEFLRLIRVGRPPVVVGEQVASKLGREWLAGVRTDLEALGYAVGAADLCAASVGAPHIRQRLYWVGLSQCNPGRTWRPSAKCSSSSTEASGAGASIEPGRSGMSDSGLQQPEGDGREQRGPEPRRRRSPVSRCGAGSPEGWLADANGRDTSAKRQQPGGQHGQQQADGGTGGGLPEPISGQREWFPDTDSGNNNRQTPQRIEGHGLVEPCGDTSERLSHNNNNTGLEIVSAEPARQECPATERSDEAGFWERGVFVPCLDGKARRVEPGIFPLADGFPNRVGALRGSGNAIVPQVGATFLKAVMEATNGDR